MRVLASIAVALISALACVVPAQARDQFGQRDVVTIDPNRAYIFYRAPRMVYVSFLREVDAEDLAAWRVERARAFTRARARWEQQAADWDSSIRNCSGNGQATRQCQGRGQRPAEVTDENFVFAPPEMSNFRMVEGRLPFSRESDGVTYLIAVQPGTYILYGPVIRLPDGGTFGLCLCMGSVRFEARAGQIVDMGAIRYPRLEARLRLNERRFGPNRLSELAVVPPTPSMAIPARLVGGPIMPAQLHGADKLPNYFGIDIDRLPPIPGVLDYDRDRVIDLAADPAPSEG